MTQTDEELLQHTAASFMPETEPAPQAHGNGDDESDINTDLGDSNDDLDELDNLLKRFRIRMTSIKNERNVLREQNQALQDENVARNAELEESSRRLRAQLDQAEVRLRTSETAVERLSQQVAETEERARAAENDLENTRLDLSRTNRINSLTRAVWPVSDAVKFRSLKDNFGPDIAEALTSLPADRDYCIKRYRMTSSTQAQGPDRRANYHPEFKPADGPGGFVMLRGKVAWVKILLQEQY